MCALKIVKILTRSTKIDEDLKKQLQKKDAIFGSEEGYALQNDDGEIIEYSNRPIQRIKDNIYCGDNKIFKVENGHVTDANYLFWGNGYTAKKIDGEYFVQDESGQYLVYLDKNGKPFNVSGYVFTTVEKDEVAKSIGLIKLHAHTGKTEESSIFHKNYYEYYLDTKTENLFLDEEVQILKTIKQNPQTAIYIVKKISNTKSRQFIEKFVDILCEYIKSSKSPVAKSELSNLYSSKLQGDIALEFNSRFGAKPRNYMGASKSTLCTESMEK